MGMSAAAREHPERSASDWLHAEEISALEAYDSKGEYDKAITLYEEDLREHPHNGWALYGIKQALAAQGRSDEEIDRRFEEAWARSDTWILGSKF